MKAISIGEMLREIDKLCGLNTVSRWEESFIEGMMKESDNGADTAKLSEKQVELIDTIFHKHFA